MGTKTYGAQTIGGLSFIGCLQLLFIALKLLNKITWSWWVVLLPALIEIGLFLIIGIALTLISVLSRRGNKRI